MVILIHRQRRSPFPYLGEGLKFGIRNEKFEIEVTYGKQKIY